jgi:hypothetical protein
MQSFTALSWETPQLSNSASGISKISPLFWVDMTSDPAANANAAAAALKPLPAGQRGIFPSTLKSLMNNPADKVPWLDNGAKTVKAWLTTFLAALKATGTPLDFISGDSLEYVPNLSAWNMTQDQMNGVFTDPRFKAIAQALKITAAPIKVDGVNDPNFFTFNKAVNVIARQYFQQAILDTLLTSGFTSTGYSEFSDVIVVPSQAANFSDSNGWCQSWGGHCGNLQGPVFYPAPEQITEHIQADWTNPINILIWLSNCARAIVSSGPQKAAPFYAPLSYGSPLIANTPWWKEIFLHTMMALRAENCTYWNPTGAATAADDQAMNEAMNELAENVRLIPNLIYTVTTQNPTPWNAPQVVTTIQSLNGNHTLSRVTTAAGGSWQNT